MKAPRFTVYHVRSTMEQKSFYFEHHARALIAKLNAREQRHSDKPVHPYAYTTIANYRDNVVHMVTRVNLMSGEEYQEPSNTPNYCSPASEAYWSM